MKWLAVLLVLLAGGLQYRLWNGPGSMEEVISLRRAIEEQTRENGVLVERNQALEAEVHDLKAGLEAVEERARMELGMVKKDESFFLVVEK
jgi:cell division protein FtsB